MVALVLLMACLSVTSAMGDPSEELPPCPVPCECHHFRINWVTDCSDANLTKVPIDGLSPKTYVLNMNGNSVASLGQLPSGLTIRRLLLGGNRMTQLTRNDFAPLEYLIELDLSYNNISVVDQDAFEQNEALMELNLTKNPLKIGDNAFLNSKSLESLDLTSCGIEDLNTNFFIGLHGLKTLELSDNPLKALRPGVFDPLIRLQELRLNRCGLGTIDPYTFSVLDNLKILELSHNEIDEDLKWAPTLRSLETLDLSSCGITSLPENVFHNNKWLTKLILSGNSLSNSGLRRTFGLNMATLDYLDVSNCSIAAPLPNGMFLNEVQLKTLLFSDNPVPEKELMLALSPLSSIRKLDLCGCSLTGIPIGTFTSWKEIEELDLSHNSLAGADLFPLADLQSLRLLDLSYSGIERLDSKVWPFSGMSELRTLILKGNPLKELEPGFFTQLHQLERLELNECGITELPGGGLQAGSPFPKLTMLILSNNPFSVPTFPEELRSLSHLDLSACTISSLPNDTLQGFDSLVSLNLAENEVTQESLGFLGNLPSLEELDLNGNKMEELNPKLFIGNPSLRMLKLGDNNWTCDCYISELFNWAFAVKGDPDVIPGLTPCAVQDIAEGGCRAKRRDNLLTCRDSQGNQLTWAEFSVSSSCNVNSVGLKYPPLSLTTTGAATMEHRNCYLWYLGKHSSNHNL